jgi:hypothetical protein
MKPPLPHSESAVPRTPHAQLEIAKAMRMLMAPDQDELLRRRRAEIAAIRGELEAIKRDLQKAGEECLALVKAELRAALAEKYNPDQPRVPAGNRDGGQWMSGGETGGDASADLSGGVPDRRTRYALADTNARIDADGGSSAHVTTLQDAQNHLRNLYNVLLTALRSRMGDALNFFGSHYLDIKIVGADEVPDNHSRQPVPFTDSDNKQIYDAQGNPLLRPIGLPPELYAQAGLAVRSWAQIFIGLEQGGTPQDPDAANARSMALAIIASNIVLPLAPGGPLDAERFDWTYVRDYRHYQNTMIGVYGAAAGMSEDQVLG